MSKQVSQKSPVTLMSLALGFSLSVVLTVAAYMLVVTEQFDKNLATAAVLGLAVIQVIAQLVFFFHLGRENKPRWNMTVFYFMLVFLVVLVGGSIWVMHSLNYNMMDMSPHEKDMYMMHQGEKGF